MGPCRCSLDMYLVYKQRPLLVAGLLSYGVKCVHVLSPYFFCMQLPVRQVRHQRVKQLNTSKCEPRAERRR